MHNCLNHPTAAACNCSSCHQPYCENCLVEFLGARYCEPCRNVRLAEAQGQPLIYPRIQALYAGTGTVNLSRWLGRGWEMLMAAPGVWALATLTTVLLGLLTCGLALSVFAREMYEMALRQVRGEHPMVEQWLGSFSRFQTRLSRVSIFEGALVLVPMGSVIKLWIANMLLGSALSLASAELNEVVVSTYASVLISSILLLLSCVILFFAYPRLVASPVTLLTALTDSLTVVRRNFWGFLTATLLLGLIHVCVGGFCPPLLLLTIPLLALTTAQAYVDHFGLEEAELRQS